MNFLVIDGNSILNRAFYGIKVLTTKDGRFTNAIYGFMNIFLRLKDECRPEAVAVAFDVKQPTFRHEAAIRRQERVCPTSSRSSCPCSRSCLKPWVCR